MADRVFMREASSGKLLALLTVPCSGPRWYEAEPTHTRDGGNQGKTQSTCDTLHSAVFWHSLVEQTFPIGMLYYHPFRQSFIFSRVEVQHGERRKRVQGGRPPPV